jgi:hypothetical protein
MSKESISTEVLEEFAAAAWPYAPAAEIAQSELDERRKVADKERKATERGVARIVRQVNAKPRKCACGCGRVVPPNQDGRPRIYATEACRCRVWRRRWKNMPSRTAG